MNSRDKYEQDKERFDTAQQKQDSIYYLQRKLKEKDIAYTSRKKIIFPTPAQTEDKHIKRLLKEHNYTVQTIIE